MKITDYRDTQGRFKKKRRIKTILNWLILLGIIAIIIYAVTKHSPTPTIAPTTPYQPQDNSGVQAVMNEADFQAEMKLQAQTIELNREKDAENARHTAEMTRIESALEQVRQQQLNTPSLQ